MPSCVTLAELSALAEHCPILHALEIMLDVTFSPDIGTKRAARESLHRLDVLLSPINDPGRVATFYAELLAQHDADEDQINELLVAAEVLERHNRWNAVSNALQQD
ncbi:hypothetical protein DFH09DRAFT_1307814 [Mycena vulgaris]|nr:hypothetical protein DFH09DRAFT_1307814 [Mycena vulgaris]